MDFIFIIIRDLLIRLSSITKLSYNEVNIVVYYYVLPFFYFCIIDYKIETHLLKIPFIILSLLSIIVIKDFKVFSDSLFNKSVKFLRFFKIVGWNYVVSSVIICIIVPIILLIFILIV